MPGALAGINRCVPVDSHIHKRGDRFKLEVAQPIAVDESIIVLAGSPAIGEVVHAAKPGTHRCDPFSGGVLFDQTGDAEQTSLSNSGPP